MEKLIFMALILTVLGVNVSLAANLPNFDELARSMYEERLSTEEGEEAPYYKGQIFVYDQYIVVYVPEMKKWTFVRLSDLRDVAVAKESEK